MQKFTLLLSLLMTFNSYAVEFSKDNLGRYYCVSKQNPRNRMLLNLDVRNNGKSISRASNPFTPANDDLSSDDSVFNKDFVGGVYQASKNVIYFLNSPYPTSIDQSLYFYSTVSLEEMKQKKYFEQKFSSLTLGKNEDILEIPTDRDGVKMRLECHVR